MKSLNKRGISMVEMIVSIALISIVIIFLMNLFLNVRMTYNLSKTASDYEIVVSTITKAVGSDIEKYGLYSIEEGKNKLTLIYDEYRPTKLSERIEKVLEVTKSEDGRYTISYGYDKEKTEDMTSDERITNVKRALPDGTTMNNDNFIKYESTLIEFESIVDIGIPIYDENGNNYSININGIMPNPNLIVD